MWLIAGSKFQENLLYFGLVRSEYHQSTDAQALENLTNFSALIIVAVARWSDELRLSVVCIHDELFS
jgi:hypothetical protein